MSSNIVNRWLEMEADTCAKQIFSAGSQEVKAKVAAYGCHIIAETEPSDREIADFNDALTSARSAGYMLGYERVNAKLTVHPDSRMPAAFNSYIARAVAEMAIGTYGL